ncbi:unnamed protein product [Cochlearia groenlandica]
MRLTTGELVGGAVFVGITLRYRLHHPRANPVTTKLAYDCGSTIQSVAYHFHSRYAADPHSERHKTRCKSLRSKPSHLYKRRDLGFQSRCMLLVVHG